MDDQTPEVVAEEVPPQEQVATAAPESDQTPEEAKPAAKTFTQEEVDELISKRLAREQRKWEREQQQRLEEQKVKRAAPADIHPQDFASYDQYAEALAERKAAELLARREAEREQMALLEAYHDREEAARERYTDFEQVAYNQNLPITTVMAQTIQASDVGPDIAYYLGSNPREADRIARMSPYMQAKEIGKIEAKLADNPAPVKKTTSAPPPIKPVTAKGTSASVYDTTDPRSISAMSASEWIERERQRQIKQWEARRNR